MSERRGRFLSGVPEDYASGTSEEAGDEAEGQVMMKGTLSCQRSQSRKSVWESYSGLEVAFLPISCSVLVESSQETRR